MKRTGMIAAAAILVAVGTQVFSNAETVTEDVKADDYPLDTCVVSGEALGSMGEAVIFNYEGQEVRFCCKGCKDDFLKNPKVFLAKIAKAKADQTANKAAGAKDDGQETSETDDKDTSTQEKSHDHSGHDHGHDH